MTLDLEKVIAFKEPGLIIEAVYDKQNNITALRGLFAPSDLEAITDFVRSQQPPRKITDDLTWEEIENSDFVKELAKLEASGIKVNITTDEDVNSSPTQSQIDLAKYLVKEMPMAKDSELGKAVLDVLLRALNAKP